MKEVWLQEECCECDQAWKQNNGLEKWKKNVFVQHTLTQPLDLPGVRGAQGSLVWVGPCSSHGRHLESVGCL